LVSGKKAKRRERPFSRHDPESIRAVTPTDIKQYVYCPLIPYFERVLRVRPLLDSQQEQSKEDHERIGMLEERRLIPLRIEKFRGSRVLRNLNLQDEELHACGRLDLLLITPWGELIPVDYKFSRSNNGRAWMHHKYQLTLYAILVERRFNKVVRRGILCYVPEERVLEVRITSRLKSRVKQIIMKIIEMEVSQNPPRTWRSIDKCPGGCGYSWICIG